ncbi:MAG: hypothetical protein IRY99_04990, partial [Isosphaeraceae bacterium]|nr:hypothetical protein [Isosphaeraceae bacterium]
MIPRRPVWLPPLLLLCWAALAPADAISPAGERLARVLDGMGVEQLWQPGQPINWRTGAFDPRSRQHATHCSAFVAAACDRMGVYILRPPEHGQTFLANAQNEWLKQVGPRMGWWRVGSPVEAQRLANRGYLVVVSYRNPNPHKPGHIALVRPSDKTPQQIEEEGPQIIQAGARNASSISLRLGFAHHPHAWEGRGVEF